jgi:hypothetical protein
VQRGLRARGHERPNDERDERQRDQWLIEVGMNEEEEQDDQLNRNDRCEFAETFEHEHIQCRPGLA